MDDKQLEELKKVVESVKDPQNMSESQVNQIAGLVGALAQEAQQPELTEEEMKVVEGQGVGTLKACASIIASLAQMLETMLPGIPLDYRRQIIDTVQAGFHEKTNELYKKFVG